MPNVKQKFPEVRYQFQSYCYTEKKKKTKKNIKEKKYSFKIINQQKYGHLMVGYQKEHVDIHN